MEWVTPTDRRFPSVNNWASTLLRSAAYTYCPPQEPGPVIGILVEGEPTAVDELTEVVTGGPEWGLVFYSGCRVVMPVGLEPDLIDENVEAERWMTVVDQVYQHRRRMETPVWGVHVVLTSANSGRVMSSLQRGGLLQVATLGANPYHSTPVAVFTTTTNARRMMS